MDDPAPASIPLTDAATLPIVGLTAWQALFEHAKLTTGRRVPLAGLPAVHAQAAAGRLPGRTVIIAATA